MITSRGCVFERLRSERKRLGVSQTEFGEWGGVSKNAQANYENGSRNPDANYLAAVAKIGVDVNYVLTGDRLGDVSRYPSREFLKEFSDTLLEVREIMKGQPRDKIFDTAYVMHMKILAKLAEKNDQRAPPKKAVNE